MESVLGHAQRVVELLAVSQTEHAREWDHRTVLRALKWAQHCEKLHAWSHSNPALRSSLESRLRDTNLRLQQTLPSYSPVVLSELAQCQHKLLVNLLRNPSAPSSIIQAFIPDRRAPEMDQNRLITCKSAFKLLCCSSDRSSYSGLQVEPEVRGQLLTNRLHAILTRSGDCVSARSLLDSVIRDSAGKTERQYDVIAAAILAGDAVTGDVVLDWFRGQDGCLRELCRSLSPELSSALAQKSFTFKRGYWDVLKRWASFLEYDVMQSAWVRTGSLTSEEPVSFNVLVDRLRALLNSGSPLKEETETELTSLIMESGDFDVKGVSVWTDLSIQLNMKWK